VTSPGRKARGAHGQARGFLVVAAIFGLLVSACGAGATASPGGGGGTGQTTITIDSWRSEDAAQWNDKIIPAFEKAYPDVKVQLVPIAPTNYTSVVGSQLQGGTAADLIMAIPFDQSLQWWQAGFLADLTGLPGLGNFTDVAKGGWATDDGKTIYAVPMASVIQGYFYNEDAFKELGLTVPTTEAEFFNVLQAIKSNGKYIPLAFGDADEFLNGPSFFDNFGPNYYQGETGRQGLIKGTMKVTDPQFVQVFDLIQKMVPYMAPDPASVKYADTQTLFSLGKALIFPGGSWEISGFEKNASFKIGAFAPFLPKAGDQLYIDDHIDHGMALNAKSQHKDAAKKFLEWLTTKDFAQLYTNAVPGFFALNTAPVQVDDPVAADFESWLPKAKTTIRPFYQFLSRGTPNTVNEENTVIAGIINGTMTPQAAAQKLQSDLDQWYKPGAPPTVAPFSAAPSAAS
jgi:raffinose/stachyose/melibiose transport system substrate-binding protein